MIKGRVGIRTHEAGTWYGEVKIYRDGEDQSHAYCETGLEDYAGVNRLWEKKLQLGYWPGVKSFPA